MTTAAPPDTRERILRATVDLIGREGISAVTNRRIATATDISLGSLTYHYPSQVELLRDSLLLFVSDEVARLANTTVKLRRRRLSVEQVAAEVEQIVGESSSRLQQLAEAELHLHAARDPALQEASRRCFEAYEGAAEAVLEMLSVPQADRHARAIVAVMYGLALRRLGTGEEGSSGVAEALLTIVRGASR